MSIDQDTVRRVARLAKLRMTDESVERSQASLNQILAWIDQLTEVDTSSVQPMFGVTKTAMPRRADVITDGGYPKDILLNAPEAAFDLFSVPKVVE